MSVPPSADTDVPGTPDGPEPPDTGVAGDRLVVMAAEPDERGPQDFPSRSDGFVRGLAEAIGGPIGQHAAGRNTPGGIRHRFWSAARIVLALTCLTLVMHYVQKSPCRDGDWGDNIQYKEFCYTDVLALYYAEGLSNGQVPYRDHAVEYPVLTGAFMGLIGLPVHNLGVRYPGMNQGEVFYDVNAVVLGALAVATAGVMLSLRRRRPWDVALFALAPTLFVTTTVNWDFLAIGLALIGMWAWARRRPVWAGVLIGLGTAAKLWPLFILGPLLVLCIRAGRLRAGLLTVLSAAAIWVVVNLPIYLMYPKSWGEFARLNTTRLVDWGTLWYVGRYLDGKWAARHPGYHGPFQWLSDHVNPDLNDLTLGLFVLGCLGICALILMAPRRPRVAQVAFLVVAVFLIVNKVWSQQYTLWLLPLVVLARPRWGAFLAWQIAEIGYFTAFYAELLGGQTGHSVIPEGTFVLAATLRLVTVAILCGLVVREMLHPELDPVRQTYADDPDGGELDGAPDRFALAVGRGSGNADEPAGTAPPTAEPAPAA